MSDKNTPAPKDLSSPNNPPAIHTMQQDLAAAAPPSRFDVRHRRPLPKSQRMEDLRQKPPEKALSLPLHANKTLTPPVVSDHNITSPIFLWIAGSILALILLLIIVTIITTL